MSLTIVKYDEKKKSKQEYGISKIGTCQKIFGSRIDLSSIVMLEKILMVNEFNSISLKKG